MKQKGKKELSNVQCRIGYLKGNTKQKQKVKIKRKKKIKDSVNNITTFTAPNSYINVTFVIDAYILYINQIKEKQQIYSCSASNKTCVKKKQKKKRKIKIENKQTTDKSFS